MNINLGRSYKKQFWINHRSSTWKNLHQYQKIPTLTNSQKYWITNQNIPIKELFKIIENKKNINRIYTWIFDVLNSRHKVFFNEKCYSCHGIYDGKHAFNCPNLNILRNSISDLKNNNIFWDICLWHTNFLNHTHNKHGVSFNPTTNMKQTYFNLKKSEWKKRKEKNFSFNNESIYYWNIFTDISKIDKMNMSIALIAKKGNQIFFTSGLLPDYISIRDGEYLAIKMAMNFLKYKNQNGNIFSDSNLAINKIKKENPQGLGNIHKVAAHSGIAGNEIVDLLAKITVNQKKIKKNQLEKTIRELDLHSKINRKKIQEIRKTIEKS